MKTILVEGPPDLTLVRTLGFTRKTSSKRGGKGEVCNYLKKHTDLLALVDEDPHSTPSNYLKNLETKELMHSLLEYTDREKRHKIIALRPRLEEWILAVAKTAEIDLYKDFNLPNTAKALHDILPQKLAAFEKLIKHLVEDQSPSILFLKKQLIE
ncbi:MAG: hypothetical protein H6574_21115 [Lewinellaceae bacterium]|nr:hypothetical protein [Saprospiraceae bacterium]MCB9333569.1 hypothetical protein [Lewinellaceae bacterium]